MRPPLKRLVQTSAMMTGALALVASTPGLAGADETRNLGDDAVVGATLECGVLTATSTKDISNLVLQFASGATEELGGLSGLTYSTDVGTLYPDMTLTSVAVKSGNNGDQGTGTVVPVQEQGTDCGQEEGEGEGDEGEGAGQVPGPELSLTAGEGDETRNAGDDAVVGAVLDCGDLVVTSTKEISNIVVVFEDGTTQKFDDLSELEERFTAEELNGVPVDVFVKSGNNSDDSDDLNGTGEEVTVEAGATGEACDAAGGSTPPGENDTVEDGTGDEVDEDNEVDADADVGGPQEGALPDGGEVVVENDVVSNPVSPPMPAAPATTGVLPASPARPTVVAAAATPTPRVLGAQVTRTPDALAATGASTNDLIPFGLGLVLLGFGIERRSKRLAAARTR